MSGATVVRMDSAANELILHHGEASYPNEGAGFLLGASDDGLTYVEATLPVENKWDPGTQARRYLLQPGDWERAEREAAGRSLSVVGIFHSHPDHPPHPSQFDLDAAWPNLTYLITSVRQGKSVETLAWRLAGDRSGFAQEKIEIVRNPDQNG